MILESIIKDALSYNASDIHIQTQEDNLHIYFRVKKQILPYAYEKDIAEIPNKAIQISSALEMLTKDSNNEISTSTMIANTKCRITRFVANRRLSYAIRILKTQIPTLESIHAPSVFSSLCMQDGGLILVCGATSAGKSTTLAAMLHHINTHAKKHIITIEDPIEYEHESAHSLVSQREIGRDCKDFESALRASLRQDPDVILIGEILEKEVLKLAINHALSGHLVLTSFHAHNCMDAISRILAMLHNEANAHANLAACMQGIITQKLYDNGTALAADFEVLLANAAVRTLIKEDKIWQLDSQISMGKAQGMQHFSR